MLEDEGESKIEEMEKELLPMPVQDERSAQSPVTNCSSTLYAVNRNPYFKASLRGITAFDAAILLVLGGLTLSRRDNENLVIATGSFLVFTVVMLLVLLAQKAIEKIERCNNPIEREGLSRIYDEETGRSLRRLS